jgi:hypothetical protein
MRTLAPLLFLIAHAAIAANLPPAVTPEQPVSERVFIAAAGDQRTLGIASDGHIGFAVWLDGRRGNADLFGSRIDANGVSLDPLGIFISTNTGGGSVIWNGNQFVVASAQGRDTTFTFVTTDGTVLERKTMQLFGMLFAATMGSGPEARFLFAGLGKATIVDSNANIVMANIQLAMPTSPSLAVAAGAGDEFLLLHTNEEVFTHHLFADRLDRDGRFLGTADTGIDINVIGSTLAMAGGSDGYLLIGRGPFYREIIAAHLDRNGVMTSQRTLVPLQAGLRVWLVPPSKPAILRDGDHYEVVWTPSEPNGDAHTWRVVEPAAGFSQTEPARILDWTGSGYGTVIAKVGEQPVVVSDALRAGVSTNIDSVATSIGNALSSTATQQTMPQAAVSGNEYAVIWNEFGPDGSAHLYLRRFAGSSRGAIAEVASNPEGKAITGRIAAANGTYVIAWTTSQTVGAGTNYVVRRLSAATGEWLDPDPVPLATAFELVLAANSDSVLAAYTTLCSHRCPRARAIATDTPAMFRAAETIIPGTTTANQLAMASNGNDYLIAWNDFFCDYPCNANMPKRVLAQRLGADGRALRTKPIVIDDAHNYAAYPSVAWTGSNYALSWSEDSVTAGRHVYASGFPDAIRTILPQSAASPLIATGNSLVMFFISQTGDVRTTLGVAVDPQSLAAIGEPSLLVAGQPYGATVAAAALPNGFVLAYDRLDTDAGNVGRVFTRVYGNAPRRRAAHP